MPDQAAAAGGVLIGSSSSSSAAVLLMARLWQQERATGSSGFSEFTGMRSGRADRVGGHSFGVAVAGGTVSPVLAALNRLPAIRASRRLVGVGGAAAMIAVQAGTALMAPTWLSAAGVTALVAACQVQTRLVEEPYLQRTHGPASTAYAAGTGASSLSWVGCSATMTQRPPVGEGA